MNFKSPSADASVSLRLPVAAKEANELPPFDLKIIWKP